MRIFLTLLILLMFATFASANDDIISWSYDDGWIVKDIEAADGDPNTWIDDRGYSIRRAKLDLHDHAYFEISCLNGVTNVTYTPAGKLMNTVNSDYLAVSYRIDDGETFRQLWNVRDGTVSLMDGKGIPLVRELYQFDTEKLTLSFGGHNVTFDMNDVGNHIIRIATICGWELPKRWDSSYHGFAIPSEDTEINSEYPYIESYIFAIRCLNGVTEVGIVSHDKLSSFENKTDNLLMVYKIDDQESVWQIWKFSNHGIAMTKQGKKAMKLMQEIYDADKLTLEFSYYNYSSPKIEFDMSRSDRYVEKIAEQCNWKLD